MLAELCDMRPLGEIVRDDDPPWMFPLAGDGYVVVVEAVPFELLGGRLAETLTEAGIAAFVRDEIQEVREGCVVGRVEIMVCGEKNATTVALVVAREWGLGARVDGVTHVGRMILGRQGGRAPRARGSAEGEPGPAVPDQAPEERRHEGDGGEVVEHDAQEGGWTEGTVTGYIPLQRGFVRTDDGKKDLYFNYRALPPDLYEEPLNGMRVWCRVLYRKDGPRHTRTVVPA